MNPASHDSDLRKGAVDSGQPKSLGGESTTASMSGQLGHRDPDELIKESDSDFPEPGAVPEHSGQRS
jgi:hypothetical protein